MPDCGMGGGLALTTKGVTMLELGSEAPSFTLEDSDGQQVRLEDFRGKKVVLWFYPKDDTPG